MFLLDGNDSEKWPAPSRRQNRAQRRISGAECPQLPSAGIDVFGRESPESSPGSEAASSMPPSPKPGAEAIFQCRVTLLALPHPTPRTPDGGGNRAQREISGAESRGRPHPPSRPQRRERRHLDGSTTSKNLRRPGNSPRRPLFSPRGLQQPKHLTPSPSSRTSRIAVAAPSAQPIAPRRAGPGRSPG